MKNILVGINLLCMVMHLLFEFQINNDSKIYGFVMVENIMVAFTFLLMAFLVYRSDSCICFLYIHLIFWLLFVVTILSVTPIITTLQIVESYLFHIPQWIILLGFGITVLLLNFAVIMRERTTGISH